MRMFGFAAAVLFCSANALAQSPAPPNLIRAEVLNLHRNTGQVGCTLYNSANGFPGDSSKALAALWVDIHDGKAVCEFPAPAAGTYAIAVLHDENGNHKLDSNMLGIPKEGVGASNDAKSYGPPKFEDARFRYSGGLLTIQIHMSYF